MLDMTLRELLDQAIVYFSSLGQTEQIAGGIGLVYLFAALSSRQFYRFMRKVDHASPSAARGWATGWLVGAPATIPLFALLILVVHGLPALAKPFVKWWEKGDDFPAGV